MRIRILAVSGAWVPLAVAGAARRRIMWRAVTPSRSRTVLDSDVVCTDQDPVGLVIGGDDFTLWLEGHTIQGAGAVGYGRRRRRRHGQVRRGGQGRDDHRFRRRRRPRCLEQRLVKGLRSDAASVGIAMRGNGNYIYRNTVDMSTASGFAGIEAIGDDAYLWGNIVIGSPQASPDDGIVVHGNNPRIIYNYGRRLRVRRRDREQLHRAGIVARNTRDQLRHRLRALGHGPEAPDATSRRATASAWWSTIRLRSCAGTTANDNCTEGS